MYAVKYRTCDLLNFYDMQNDARQRNNIKNRSELRNGLTSDDRLF